RGTASLKLTRIAHKCEKNEARASSRPRGICCCHAPSARLLCSITCVDGNAVALASYFAVVVRAIEALGSRHEPSIKFLNIKTGSPGRRRQELDVHAFLDAAFGELLQGAVGARAAAHSLRADRDRHPQG